MSKNSNPYFKRLPRLGALATFAALGLLAAALAALGTLGACAGATEFTTPERGIFIHLVRFVVKVEIFICES